MGAFLGSKTDDVGLMSDLDCKETTFPLGCEPSLVSVSLSRGIGRRGRGLGDGRKFSQVETGLGSSNTLATTFTLNLSTLITAIS